MKVPKLVAQDEGQFVLVPSQSFREIDLPDERVIRGPLGERGDDDDLRADLESDRKAELRDDFHALLLVTSPGQGFHRKWACSYDPGSATFGGMANAVFIFIVACGAAAIAYSERVFGWKAEIPALPMAGVFILALFVRGWLRLRQGRRPGSGPAGPGGFAGPDSREQ